MPLQPDPLDSCIVRQRQRSIDRRASPHHADQASRSGSPIPKQSPAPLPGKAEHCRVFRGDISEDDCRGQATGEDRSGPVWLKKILGTEVTTADRHPRSVVVDHEFLATQAVVSLNDQSHEPENVGRRGITKDEIAILNQLAKKPRQSPPKHVSTYVLTVAKLGGYLDRKNDGPPGNTVLGRGLARITDIHLGGELGKILVGN